MSGQGTVLVTGGSGFIGGWCVTGLLKQGYTVRATVRDLSREAAVRAALDKIGYNGWLTIEGGDLSTAENSRRLDLIIAGK